MSVFWLRRNLVRVYLATGALTTFLVWLRCEV